MKSRIKNISIVLVILFISQIYSQQKKPTYYLSITHEVADYDAWKSGFDNHISVRKAAGLVDIFVKKDINNVHAVTALFEVKDMDKAKAFLADPALKAAMEKAGVTSIPQINFYKSGPAAAKISSGTLLSMITNRVEDFSSWKAAHQSTTEFRKKAGITDEYILQSLSDENLVTVLCSVSSLSGFDNYLFTGESFWGKNPTHLKTKQNEEAVEVASKAEIKILF